MQGLGLSVDSGFADIAASRGDTAQQNAQAIDASIKPSGVADTIFSGLAGGFKVAPVIAQAQQDQMQVANLEAQMKDRGFIDNVIRESVDNSFITQEEAMAFSQMAAQDPIKSLEALSKTANGRRSDIAATNVVNTKLAPRLQEAVQKLQEAMAKDAANRKVDNGLMAYTASGGVGQQMSAETQAAMQELQMLKQELYSTIDTDLSQALPEAREKAKRKVDEYLAGIMPQMQGQKAPSGYDRMMEHAMRRGELTRVDALKKDLVGWIKTVDKNTIGERKAVAGFNALVKDLNALPDKTRATALHPMVIATMLANPAVVPKVDGADVTPEVRGAVNKVLASVNSYLKDVSGAQVTVSEAQRLFAALGLAVPPSLGGDASKPTALAEVQKAMADAISLNWQEGKIKDTDVLNGINGLLELAQDKALEMGYTQPGTLGPQLYNDYRLGVERYKELYKNDPYVQAMGTSFSGLLGLQNAKQIKPWAKGAAPQVGVAKQPLASTGFESAAQSLMGYDPTLQGGIQGPGNNSPNPFTERAPAEIGK